MKKVFTFALVALAAAAVVACQKPASGDTTPGGDTPSGGDYVAIQSIALEPGVLELEEGESIDLPKVVVTPSNATDKGMPVTWSSKDQNIFKIENNKVVGVKAGTAKIEAILKDSKGTEFGTQVNVTVKAAVPEGNTWDYVFNTTDWHINCKADFAEALTINTGHMAMQWKFLSTKWNVYNKVDEERGYWVGCNRLGQLYDGDYGGEGILLRFGDGEVSGMLRLNGGAIIDNAYVTKDNANYVWALNEWHVLTLVADGTNVSVYDNAELVTSIPQSKAAHDWTFAALDFSETMDDGDVMYVKGQAFLGYTAYIRMWDKALSAEEVAASLCDVDPASEGLKAYWVFNYDEGYVVEDQAGKNDFDFSKIKSAADDNGGKIKDNSQAVEGAWTSVELELLPEVCAAE